MTLPLKARTLLILQKLPPWSLRRRPTHDFAFAFTDSMVMRDDEWMRDGYVEIPMEYERQETRLILSVAILADHDHNR